MAGPPIRDLFVGREPEMAVLTEALEDVLTGRGRVVTLAGEAGIGKTRTAEQLAAVARRRGVEVLWGRCPEEPGAPPYWPWIQVIRSYVRERHPVELRRAMGSGASVIADVVPDVKERMPGLRRPDRLDSPEAARFRLFDAFASFLSSGARLQPLLVVIDDLHGADTPSLLLLEFVVREIASAPVLVVCAYRDDGLAPKSRMISTLGDLTRHRGFKRVRLRGLQKRDVDGFIEMASGVSPPPGLVDAVHAQTGGNPLFVAEVIQLLVQEGYLADRRNGPTTAFQPAAAIPIPDSVREVIARRLSRLSDPCGGVLTTAAVIGRRFALAALVKIYSDTRLAFPERLSATRLTELLDEAMAARVIEELPSSKGRFQFVHALVRDTLTIRLSSTAMARLEARVALALEALYASRAEERSAELAAHFSGAEPVLGTANLIKYSAIAGEQAIAKHAFEEAATLFSQALSAAEDGAPTAGRARLLWGLARANAPLTPVEDGQRVWKIFIAAFDAFVESRDYRSAAEVATYPAGFLARVTGSTDLLTRALALVPPDSTEAGWILTRRPFSLLTDKGDYEQAVSDAMRAEGIGRKRSDPLLEARAVAGLAVVHSFGLRPQLSLEAGERALVLEKRVEDLHSAMRANFAAGWSSMRLGRPTPARLYLDAMAESAQRLRDRSYLGGADGGLRFLARLQGDFATARAAIDADDHRVLQPSRLNPELIEALLDSETGLGDPAAAFHGFAQRAIDGQTSVRGPVAQMMAQSAYACRSPEMLDLVNRWVPLLTDEEIKRPDLAFMAQIARAIRAVLNHDLAECAGLVPSLLPQSGTVTGSISVDRVIGMMLAERRLFKQATLHFEMAVSMLRQAGYQTELAWTCADYAECLLRDGAPANPGKVAGLLDEGIQIAQALDMKPLVARIATLGTTLDASHRRQLFPGGLTDREVEVLRLLALGKTNREIADALVISENTVLRHVTHILSKTGSSNRAGATAFAVRAGLTR